MRDVKLLASGKAVYEKAGKPKNIYGLKKDVELDEFKVDFKNDF